MVPGLRRGAQDGALQRARGEVVRDMLPRWGFCWVVFLFTQAFASCARYDLG
jgi:hypothetical protein